MAAPHHAQGFLALVNDAKKRIKKKTTGKRRSASTPARKFSSLTLARIPNGPAVTSPAPFT